MGRERLGEQGAQGGQYHVGDDVTFENSEEERYQSTPSPIPLYGEGFLPAFH